MELTNEEKKGVLDAAMELIVAHCTYRLAEDRFNTMNQLNGTFLQMGFDEKVKEAALKDYAQTIKDRQEKFFLSLGIKEGDEFSKWIETQIPPEPVAEADKVEQNPAETP